MFYSLFRGGLPKIAGSIPAGQRQRFLVDCRNLSDSDATSIENIRKRRRKKRSRHFNTLTAAHPRHANAHNLRVQRHRTTSHNQLTWVSKTKSRRSATGVSNSPDPLIVVNSYVAFLLLVTSPRRPFMSRVNASIFLERARYLSYPGPVRCFRRARPPDTPHARRIMRLPRSGKLHFSPRKA